MRSSDPANSTLAEKEIELHAAAKEGDIKGVKKALADGADPTMDNYFGKSAVYVAVEAFYNKIRDLNASEWHVATEEGGTRRLSAKETKDWFAQYNECIAAIGEAYMQREHRKELGKSSPMRNRKFDLWRIHDFSGNTLSTVMHKGLLYSIPDNVLIVSRNAMHAVDATIKGINEKYGELPGADAGIPARSGDTRSRR